MDDRFLCEFVAHWRDRYDWRAAEARLNSFPHFTEQVAGEAIHFIHVRGQGDSNVPILLTNGWSAKLSSCCLWCRS